MTKTKEMKNHSTFSNIFYFVGLLFKISPTLVIGEFIMGILTTLPTRLISVVGLKYIIDVVEQGEKMNFDTFVNIAHRVSREIEHSDVNLNRMEKICEKMPFLQTDTILRIVMFT